jgi:glyoxylase-like metal-dependent hydrolase (beta-lactamase superfamily II)
MVQHGFVEIADRVFVARYRQWDVTVGLVLGRDGAVVVDTRASAGQGSQVLDDARALGRDIRVTHVVNTHVHFDHTFGNVAFDDAVVHAHDNVGRTLSAEADRVRAALREDPRGAPDYGYTDDDAADVLATPVRAPDRTFGTSATIDLGDRAVTMAYAGRGHTDGDIAVHVPDTDVLFLGDLVEESADPSFGHDSWPLEWGDTLAAHSVWLEESTVVVPGHGRAVGADFVAQQLASIAQVGDLIRKSHAAGLDADTALAELGDALPYPAATLATAFRRGWSHLGAQGARTS